MKKFYFLFVVLLTACGQQQPSNDPRSISGVDSAFTGYVNLYVTMKNRPLAYDIPIQFGSLDGNTIGLCTRWSSGYRQIVIDREYWESPYTTDNERTSLIFHELGHCDLNRDHVETRFANGWPTSLMYPMNYGFYDSQRDYYFTELFNPSVASTSTTMASHAGCVEDIEVESSGN